MNPVIVIAGATCTGKTPLAVSIVKQSNGILLPLDQLHRYNYLSAGVGFDKNLISCVKNYGYHTLSPWEISGPDKYIAWLRKCILKYSDNYSIIIEGGCTSYLLSIIEAQKDDPVFSRIKIFALEVPTDSVSIINERCSLENINNIVKETNDLIKNGFISESNTLLFEKCETLYKHPQHKDKNLAWAIRISSKIYYPAFLCLTNRITLNEAQQRIINNVVEIQRYQDNRIHGCENSKIFFLNNHGNIENKLIELLNNNV